MIDTAFPGGESPKGAYDDVVLPVRSKTTIIPRRHCSLQSDDISACDNVCVRSIIDQLGQKLDVGKQGSGCKIKSHSFQTGTLGRIGIGIGSGLKHMPSSRSRSMMLSPSEHEEISNRLEAELATIQQTQWGDVSASSFSRALRARSLTLDVEVSRNGPVDQFQKSPLEYPVAALSPSSQSSHGKKRWSSRKINPSDLPPAFRISLDNAMVSSRKLSDGDARLNQQPDRRQQATPFVRKEGDHRRPSKLQRTWPPVARNKNSSLSHSFLLESSLSDLRSLAKVKSQIGSFESLPVTGSRNNGSSLALGGSMSSSVEVDPKSRPQESTSEEGEASEQNEGEIKAQMATAAPTEVLSDNTDAVPGLASALKSGKCKASLRIRWRGPEVFFIEARRRKYFQPLYYDDLLADRFKQGSDHGLVVPLLNDRFGARVSDSCPSHPNRPRRGDWSDYEDDDDDDDNVDVDDQEETDNFEDEKGAGRQTTQDRPDLDEDEPLPSDPPAIWITVYENEDGETADLRWRVKRVWDNAILDSREKERIIPDEDLLNTVKNLSGLPAIPIVNLLPGDDGEGNEKTDGDDDDNNSLSNWCTKKFYDINGEIIEELSSSEQSLDEGAMLDAIAFLAKESRQDTEGPVPPPLVDSPLEDKWKANTVDANVDVPVSRVIKPAMELRRDGSVSVIESGLDESLSVFDVDDILSNDAASQADKTKEPLASAETATYNKPQNVSGSSIRPMVASESLGSSNSSSLLVDDVTSSLDDMVHNKINKQFDPTLVAPSTSVAKDCSTGTDHEGDEAATKKSKKIKKDKKRRKDHGTLADLLSPPPITTFHGFSA